MTHAQAIIETNATLKNVYLTVAIIYLKCFGSEHRTESDAVHRQIFQNGCYIQ